MANPVVHFQIPADDIERAKRFYSTLFDWQIEPAGAEGQAEFCVIHTGPEGPDGDMIPRQSREHPFLQYILVDDVAESARQAVELGGTVLLDRTEIPGEGGAFAVLRDTEANVIGLWETTSA